jgi:hypothetical protein
MNAEQLRGVLCNFLSKNAKTVVSSDGELTLADLFRQEGDSAVSTYNKYVSHLRSPEVYADVMFVYALVHKFMVNVEILDTLIGQFSLYGYFRAESNNTKTILHFQKIQAYTYDDDPLQRRHTSSGEHYCGSKLLPKSSIPSVGQSRSRSRERSPTEREASQHSRQIPREASQHSRQIPREASQHSR